jgi:type III secretion protein L
MAKPFCINAQPVAVAPGAKIIKADDYQDYLAALELIRRAEQEAQRIIDRAHEAYEAEKLKGYDDGNHQGKKQIAEAVTQAVAQCHAYVNSIEAQVVDTIISALKIILDQLGDEQVILQMVTMALRDARKDGHLKLKVSPLQTDVVRRWVISCREKTAGLEFIDVVPDETLPVNGCIVSSKAGSTDISLDVQLEVIRATLNERMIQNKSDE